ncbi:VPLPA-CTERM sorting domain-containing protein [Hwanghaeella grinnelliae]|uniref:VPLPA-CTERM sorting domain-containing protein n=1 Tax=Hwanghaeella grinnelliae TaxID=2500179 RepID=A0A437QIS5_9PROT|nr:VPLPA-CTERM sorting domain-containing protein [Hwanghaeella grinnelliae]
MNDIALAGNKLSGTVGGTNTVSNTAEGTLTAFGYYLYDEDNIAGGVDRIARKLVVNSDGLGIDDVGGTQIDNNEQTGTQGGFDADWLVVQFDSPQWVPVSAVLNGNNASDHVDIYVGNDTDNNGDIDFLELTQVFSSNIAGTQEILFQDILGPLAGTAFEYLVFSTELYNTPNTNSFDQYVVTSITGNNVSAVPIPAALPLLATAFAGLGFLARRRKRIA